MPSTRPSNNETILHFVGSLSPSADRVKAVASYESPPNLSAVAYAQARFPNTEKALRRTRFQHPSCESSDRPQILPTSKV
jgi:hypothetical protein